MVRCISLKKGEEMNQMPLADLGPEPFDAELTPQYLQERLQKTNRKIKSCIIRPASFSRTWKYICR